jgi:geranylgeranylglycerol-phosphate geranylgeranyltransferase
MTPSTVQRPNWIRIEERARLRRALALIHLVRPLNMVMIAAGVFVGGFLADGSSAFDRAQLLRLILASLSVIGIAGGANSFNDVADEAIDRVNRPRRPIASGLVSRRTGLAVWLSGTVLGIVIGAFLSPTHLLVAVVAAVLMAAYNLRLKRAPLAGNVVVSLLVATSIVFGAMAIGAASSAYYAAGFAFLVTLSREIVKDVEDLEGDLLAGARTTAVVYGAGPSRRIAGAIIAPTIIATPVPFLFSDYSGLYLSIVLIAGICLVSALAEVASENGSMSRASTRLKFAMVFGLAALAFAHALD